MYPKDTGLMSEPNMISNVMRKSGGRLEGNDEFQAVWTAVAMLAGALDTVIASDVGFACDD